jgi:alpha-L-fucosidase
LAITPAADRDLISAAATVTPSPRQWAWQQLEFYAFVHYSPNAFTDREWGDGREDPAIFDPTAFDADQWAAACKDAGMGGLILTAKHHDGFCLWPSARTRHSVASSPWRQGRGDMVAEVATACDRAGLKFGLYLSPWDRHEPCYGDSPAYNEFFRSQLRELLTGYGEIFSVWFDGACGEGPNGRVQEYDFASYYAMIRELQPNAVISVCGPDVRWCGNEAGHCRPSEWSVVPAGLRDREKIAAESQQQDNADFARQINATDDDLGSRERLRSASQLVWFPAEVNTSIRPGWFYHADQDDSIKSLEHLLDVYYGSVGGNASFLLNVPPDQRGRIHQNDVSRLDELGRVLRQTFGVDLAAGAQVTASHLRQGSTAASVVDGDPQTCWSAEDWQEQAELELRLPAARTFDVVMLQEQIRLGQRLEKVAVDAWINGGWQQLMETTVVGHKRLLRFAPVTSARLRVRVLASRLCPTLSRVALFKQP